MKINQLFLKRWGKLLILSVSLIGISSCGQKQNGRMRKSNEFAVRTLKTADTNLENTYPAVIRGKQDIEIRPKIAGFITKLCVDEGSVVKKGQILFKIDDVQYAEAVNQAKAAVKVAKASIATANLTYNNKIELKKEGIIGDYEMQTATNALASASATLAQANAALVIANQNLDYCHIKSPSDGVVGSIPYRVGSLVSGSVSLTIVSNIKEMYVYFSMNEKDLLKMTKKAGDIDSTIKSFPSVKLRLADGTLYSEEGKISTISGVIDQTTGSVSIRADFANPNSLLKSGGSGTIVIPYIYKEAIIIPQTATLEIQDKKFVYVVDENNKVKYTNVSKADVDDGQNYIITSGLKAGERIVTQGITSLTDGATITPITEEAAAEKIKQAVKMGATQGQRK
ncbi:MAG: efflux RND transporter periplasmic adaptor subunit [Prolixibacteraceae bacterium]|nr:efflux RND transporter periplasmic adaptor subunit [Prolixibacteraceae bacterium]